MIINPTQHTFGSLERSTLVLSLRSYHAEQTRALNRKQRALELRKGYSPQITEQIEAIERELARVEDLIAELSKGG